MGNENTIFVQAYSDNIKLLAQQKMSRLRAAVLAETGVVGKAKYVDQIGAGTATQRVSRHPATPVQDPNLQRRKIDMLDYDYAVLLDGPDKLKMLADPTSSYVMNAVAALNRAMDQVIINAATGTAYAGEAGGTSTTLASFDGGSHVVASGATGLTLTKLLTAKELIDENDVDPEEPRFLVCTAGQMTDLLNTTEVKSADYNSVRALVQGQIDTFLGFKFIRSELLNTTGGERMVIAFAKTGIALAIAKDITARVDERADLSYAMQTYVSMGLGATRLEESKVVELLCAE